MAGPVARDCEARLSVAAGPGATDGRGPCLASGDVAIDRLKKENLVDKCPGCFLVVAFGWFIPD